MQADPDLEPWKFYFDPSAGPIFSPTYEQMPEFGSSYFYGDVINCISNNNDVQFQYGTNGFDPNEFLNPAALVSSDGESEEVTQMLVSGYSLHVFCTAMIFQYNLKESYCIFLCLTCYC